MGEVAVWEVPMHKKGLDVRFAPGNYAAWAKGVLFQDKPAEEGVFSGANAALAFGERLGALDKVNIHFGLSRDQNTWEREGGLTEAFALQCAFTVVHQQDIGYHPPNLLRLIVEPHGFVGVRSFKLMVMRVEKVTVHGV